jgi:hypothetical protein
VTVTPSRRDSDHSPRLFDPLEQDDFSRLKYAAYLKGLLKPFKGKGELMTWAEQCSALQDGLAVLAQRLVAQATAYPFRLLPVILAQQNTGAGTVFLRWRTADRSAMGVSLWGELIEHSSTPPRLVHELFRLELQRIALNMQISLTHSISRQARECAAKMAQAEIIYLRRVSPPQTSSDPQERTL